MARKVLVIGVDGGSWSIFDPLMQKGIMPGLKEMVQDGIRGILQSTVPPITPVAWASFQTGVNPGKHGVFGFVKYYVQNNRIEIINSRSLKTETIWEYLSKQGKNVASINVPLTYPPRRINGCMIGGMFTPSVESDFIHPRDLRGEIIRNIGGYLLPETSNNYRPFEDFQSTIKYLIELVRNRTAVALYLLNRRQWDLFMVHFQATDFLQHPFWGYMKEDHALFNREKADCIAEFYKELDKALVEIMRNEGEETITIVMSDHGFRSNDKIFYLNSWLFRNNLFFPSKSNLFQKLIDIGIPILRKIDRYNYLARISPGTRIKREISRIMERDSLDFDVLRTVAYGEKTSAYGMIRLNCDKDVYQRERNSLIDKLAKLKDPETNEKIIDAVFTKEDLYKGEMIELAPDLIIRLKEGYTISTIKFEKRKIFRKTEPGKDLHIGTHDENGMFVFHGGAITKKKQLVKASIVDLYPTILYALRVPIPGYIDGKVLFEVLIDKFVNQKQLHQY